jgi:hypothetical protein
MINKKIQDKNLLGAVNFRLSVSDRERFEMMVEASGMKNKSDYFREYILNQNTKSTKDKNIILKIRAVNKVFRELEILNAQLAQIAGLSDIEQERILYKLDMVSMLLKDVL